MNDRRNGSTSAAGVASYFVSAPVDWTVIGGLSIAVFLVFRFVPGSATSSVIPAISPFLVWGVSYPHFASTSYRLYGSRSTLRQYPLTAVVTPMIFVTGIVASFVSPATVAPAFVKLYQLWSPYHFSGQTLGLTLLYARRSQVQVDRVLRRALRTFIITTFLYGSARAESRATGGRFYGVSYPSLHLPHWVPTLLAVSVWTAAAVLLAVVVRRHLAGGGAIPYIVFLPALTQCVWFTTAPIPAYYNLVFFFHSLQYLFVAWHLQLRLALDRSKRRSGSVPFVVGETGRWWGLNIAFGFVLFWVLPHLGVHFGRSLAFSTAVILVAIQTHHFFVDGVIWRLRDQAVSSPLSSSLAEVSGRVAGVTA